MSIVEYFLFCLQQEQWAAPAIVKPLPQGLLSDEL